MSESDRSSTVREIAALVRAHVEWEREWTGASSLPHMSAPAATQPAPSAGPRALPSSSDQGRHDALRVIADEAARCSLCRLSEGRTKSVFARGRPDAAVAFVGEGPGFHEDQEGVPFVGAAGELLDKMVAAMGFRRDDVYVCNVVKCRPPENRTPLPDEVEACMPFLERQLEIVRPRVIVALGRSAGQGLGCFGPEARGWRGAWQTWRGIDVMPTYHPAFLLRTPAAKREVWEDLQKVMAKLSESTTQAT